MIQQWQYFRSITMQNRRIITALVSAFIMGMACPIFAAAKPLYKTDPVLGKGLKYLMATQAPNGGWVTQVGPAVTALAVKAMVKGGIPVSNPAVVKAMKFIESFHQPDGGFYARDLLQNYNTAIVLSTLAVLPHKQYAAQIKAAQHYLMSLQHLAGQKTATGKIITPDSSWYGGVGYGHDRPDLSNTAFFIQALHDSGVPASNPAMKAALAFVTHCQENSETNSMAWAKGTHNGGFIYTPVNGGGGSFGDHDTLRGSAHAKGDLNSQWTPYGSMTYAGLKSMIYCGLTRKDPRVIAAIKWIRANWTLNSNPGTGGSRMGLFYYYMMFTRALHALHVKTITDDNGIAHHWRSEIRAKLKSLQNSNGSWKNKWSPRWLEFSAPLVTSYVCLILDTVDR
jgi:squalene-hopene/tetraprenyl-beta-curcumene cyclase